jgi:hypothetical protein
MPIYSIIDHRTGYDETTGMAFVYPKHSSDIVNDQLFGVLKSLNKEQQELIKAADPNDKEAVNKALGLISDKQKKVIDYLRNLLILVTIRRDSDWGIPNALLHDVFIETQEVMPPEAYIVPRNTLEVDYNAKRPIKPRENK